MPALGLEEGKMEALMKLMLESNQKMESRIQQIESRIEEIHQETKDCLYEIYKALPGAAAAKRTPAFHNKLDFDSAKDEEKRRELEEVKRQEKMFKDQEEAKSKERILQELEDKKKKQELLHLQLIVEDKIFSTMAGDKKAGGGDKKKEAKKKEVKKETGLGLSIKKDENFGEWYSEKFFDAEIKKLKVQNCNYSLFVSESALQKEKDHVEGFAPEVAWVTKSGKSELEKPIAIRPTSETIMYPSYAKQIRSHHDLPLKLNQWCNVVRWEFSNPTPFIRSREFLWQEGHTAFATKEEADEEVLQILELYRRIYEEVLAVPVIKGKKSENEKFAGGLYTTSVEAYIPHTGRAVQGATSHCLGQNFAKMFEINFQNEKGERSMVWQNSWAYSTRTIGVMVMVHGDDKGLVLPPKVASVQVIVVPVPYKDANTQGIYDACEEVVKALCDAGIRAEADLRDNYSPGWKYSNWEMKGVPLRIEIGPKDLANKQVRVVRRHNSAKADIARDILVEQVKELLDNVHQSMFDAAKEKRDACVQVVKTWDEFTEALHQKKMILAPWCDEQEVEQDVKNRTKGETGAAKTLCTPFEQPELPEGTKCFASDKIAKKWTYWGRSY